VTVSSQAPDDGASDKQRQTINSAALQVVPKRLYRELRLSAFRGVSRFDGKRYFVRRAVDLFKNQFVMSQIDSNNFKSFKYAHA
jgi:hypothetical protein